ncbi:MAG: hypothetical protein ABFS24_12725 [Pseudomonadota bacterium]
MRNLMWVVAITGLSACQLVNLQHVDGPFAVGVDDEAYWLEEWHRVIALPEDQLLLTFRTREHEFEQSANPGTRLHLALLLAEGPQPVRDQARALKLLTELDAGQASDSARALAALLKQVIEEQRWSIDKMTELNRKLKTSQTHVEALELQLQELATIEQNIQQRELPDSEKE